jgi:hypothetical protein
LEIGITLAGEDSTAGETIRVNCAFIICPAFRRGLTVRSDGSIRASAPCHLLNILAANLIHEKQYLRRRNEKAMVIRLEITAFAARAAIGRFGFQLLIEPVIKNLHLLYKVVIIFIGPPVFGVLYDLDLVWGERLAAIYARALLCRKIPAIRPRQVTGPKRPASALGGPDGINRTTFTFLRFPQKYAIPRTRFFFEGQAKSYASQEFCFKLLRRHIQMICD